MRRFGKRPLLFLPVGLSFLHQAAVADPQCIAPDTPNSLADQDRRAVVFTSKDNAAVLSGFALDRTLDNILKTARGDMGAMITPGEREVLLDSLLTTLADTKLTNEDSGLTFTVKPRPGESKLRARDLLDPNNPETMIPVGLFNRLDLAPKDLRNCGEYRIVYAKKNPGGLLDRFLLIFEASLPNPDPNSSATGCQEVAKFWDSLRTMTDAQATQPLLDFYYTGGKLPSGKLDFQPVVDFRHYGLLGGQVRGNAFDDPQGQPWHLRQWTISLTQTLTPTFTSTPINENPVPAFFGGAKPDVEPMATYDQIAGAFLNKFVRDNVRQLTSVDGRAAIPIGPATTAQELFANLGVDIDDDFYAIESASGPGLADDPTDRAQGTPLEQEIEKALKAAKLDQACGLTSQHILNRMGAMTCGGCHEFSTTRSIAPGINWPSNPPDPLRHFVHINEEGVLSELLLQRFLPARFALVQKTVNESFPLVAALPTTKSIDSRKELVQLLEKITAPSAKSAMSENNKRDDLDRIDTLSKELRETESAQAGAFVLFRLPD
jgi:hypothetical protein